MSELSAYERPSVTVDIAILAPTGDRRDKGWEVLLIRRGHDPYAGCWALPGGFIDPGESLEQAAARELAEETGLENISMRQLHAYSTPGRDPRGWVITVTFVAVVNKDEVRPVAGDDAAEAAWFALDPAGPPYVPANVSLAFDHSSMLADAVHFLAGDRNVRMSPRT
jgi:8-oxo-dGTP diphosphatase